MTTRDLCTPDELARMQRYDLDDANIYTVEHPTRLHDRFVQANAEEHGHRLLSSTNLGDGFTRCVYELNVPSAMKRTTAKAGAS